MIRDILELCLFCLFTPLSQTLCFLQALAAGLGCILLTSAIHWGAYRLMNRKVPVALLIYVSLGIGLMLSAFFIWPSIGLQHTDKVNVSIRQLSQRYISQLRKEKDSTPPAEILIYLAQNQCYSSDCLFPADSRSLNEANLSAEQRAELIAKHLTRPIERVLTPGNRSTPAMSEVQETARAAAQLRADIIRTHFRNSELNSFLPQYRLRLSLLLLLLSTSVLMFHAYCSIRVIMAVVKPSPALLRLRSLSYDTPDSPRTPGKQA